MSFLRGYLAALIDPTYRTHALKVAAIVGSILFAINHGAALTQNKMTRERWISGLLTYCVPYMVSVHGQYVSRTKPP